MLFVGPFKLAMQMPSWDRFLQQFSATSCTPGWKFFGLAFSFVDIKLPFPPPRFLLRYIYTPVPTNRWESPPLHFCYLRVYWWLHVFLSSPVCPFMLKSQWNFHSITERVYESRCVVYTGDTRGMRGWLWGAKSALCLWHAVGFPNDFPLTANRRWLWQHH